MLYEERGRTREADMADMHRVMGSLATGREPRSASMLPASDLRAQLQQQTTAFEERTQAKGDHMADIQKHMADMLGHMRLLRANQTAPRARWGRIHRVMPTRGSPQGTLRGR